MVWNYFHLEVINCQTTLLQICEHVNNKIMVFLVWQQSLFNTSWNLGQNYVCMYFFRVPSNCRRNFQLLAFDPDGDEVKCRYASLKLSECANCNEPPPLSLSPVSNVPKHVLYQTFASKFCATPGDTLIICIIVMLHSSCFFCECA